MNKKPIVYGILGGIFLFSIYLIIMVFFAGYKDSINQLIELKEWIIPLIIGFSIQVGLYTHMRSGLKGGNGAANKALATSGTTSTGSMIACCAHHLTDVLPLLGFTAATIFVTKYQTSFLLLGIISNVIGILFMTEIIKKHNLYDRLGFFSFLSILDMKKMKNVSIILGVMIITSSFLLQR